MTPRQPGFYYSLHAVENARQGKLSTSRSSTGYDPLDCAYINPTFNLREDVASQLFFLEHFENKNLEQPLCKPEQKQDNLLPRAANFEARITKHNEVRPSFWTFYCSLVTFWALPVLLRACGIKGRSQQEAWREKIGLLSIIAIITLTAGFFTFGFHFLICNENSPRIHVLDIADDSVVIHGHLYKIEEFGNWRQQFIRGSDASLLFQNLNGNCKFLLNNSYIPTGDHGNVEHYFPCVSLSLDGQPIGKHGLISNMRKQVQAPQGKSDIMTRGLTVPNNDPPPGNTLPATLWPPSRRGRQYKLPPCSEYNDLREVVYGTLPIGEVYYTWADIENLSNNLAVLSGNVVDLDRLLLLPDECQLSSLLQRVQTMPYQLGHRDISLQFAASRQTRRAARCLIELAKVGVLDTESLGCLVSHIVLVLSLLFVFSIVILKFVFAVYFEWFLAWRFGSRTCEEKRIWNSWSIIRRTAENLSRHFRNANLKRKIQTRRENGENKAAEDHTASGDEIEAQHDMESSRISTLESCDDFRHIICLVTVFNEDKVGISRTLDSICVAKYAPDKRLLLIICDGKFPRREDNQCTSDIVLSLVQESDDSKRTAIDRTCISLGVSEKKTNCVEVRWGVYKHLNREISTVVVVKKGSESEQNGKMPGNRGKRDSQIMLMRFLANVAFQQRMTDFENELRLAIAKAYNNDAALFEAVLMVDADTEIDRDAIIHMTSCMFKDSKIIGLCGETEVRNKCDSWITVIQVFEYFISHHLTKAFESVFGGVSCLPGCFCMYRINVPTKANSFLPILSNTDIIVRYASTSVNTLHQKNLLLLGEDRYLSTLMLQTFPQRRVVFVPQAKCKTTVPSTFSKLLHQRRRWINSTIHNLLELILVRELCGVFCISMKMVIVIELIGTVTLPAALVFAVFLIAGCIYKRPVPVLPLIFLATLLGIPAVLILLTGHNWIHVVWMAVYVVSLPIWNFVLPLYACKSLYTHCFQDTS
jgi:chitin synthase